MYTRNFINEQTPPSSYDGVAMRDNLGPLPPLNEPPPPPNKRPPKEQEKGGILEEIFGNLHIGLPRIEKFGFEEILIIAVAALMFFSDSGDKECAVILLLLLLIN